MTLNSLFFIDHLPTLDLHGYDRECARVAINDFIRDSQKQKQELVTIVHGIGSGILRKTTLETLKKNKGVVEYKLSYFNQGCTIVQLNI